jgi:hypothetical protein
MNLLNVFPELWRLSKPDLAGLRAEVRGRPNLQAKTRAGYWTLP